jgi:F-type H+-transporting ATPase subunit epsilon
MLSPTPSGSPASDSSDASQQGRITVPLNVDLVSAERRVWSGEANFVVARTLDGELGILPGHISLLGVLAEGFTVRITGGEAGDGIEAAAHGGFLSVSADNVTILTEIAELSTEIDVERARAALARATAADGGGDDADGSSESAAARARARLAAAGQSV